MYLFDCLECGKAVIKVRRGKFCDHRCANAYNIRQNPSRNSIKQRICRNCRTEFTGVNNQLYCSKDCSEIASNAREKRFAVQIKRRYGLTLDVYNKMLDLQNGRCAICGRTDVGRISSKRLFVDHCHKTGKVRGILCYKCNTIIGHAEDDPVRLRKCAEYLEEDGADIPRYEFQCPKCHKVIELQRSMKDTSTPLCVEDGCDGQQEMEQLISKSSFSLKGSGWASDGYSKIGGG